MKISIHRTFLKLLNCLLKPARGVQTDGQNGRFPAYSEMPGYVLFKFVQMVATSTLSQNLMQTFENLLL